MVEICCKVFERKTNNEVFDGFKKVSKIFENMDDFYNYMYFKYNFDTSNYRFLVSGRQI